MRMRNDHRVDSPLIRSRTADTRLEFPATRIFEFERVSSRMETTISRCIPDGNTGNEPSPEISRLLDRLLFIPLEFLPNFHACSRYFGNTRRFLKRGNFAVNFRQGPVLISTSDIIESRQDYILREVEFERRTGWAMKNFTRKEYLRKCALWKRSFIDRENLKNFEKLCNIWKNWTQSKIIWT